MKYFIITCLLLLGLGCKTKEDKDKVQISQLLDTTKSEWISLMNKEDWKGFNSVVIPAKWTIENDLISCKGEGGEEGGDIITVASFNNFELEFKWKISNKGNSGVFYHVLEDPKYKYPYETGAEFQILDDAGFEHPIEEWQKAGANYAMHIPNGDKKLKIVGEWNTSKIVFKNGEAEHWLNGKKIIQFNKNSESWKEKRNSGKWNDYPDYGISNEGHFALQDHGAGVWFKDVRVKEL